MRKIICFGAGAIGRRYAEHFSDDDLIEAFADNDAAKVGGCFLGHKVISPREIRNYDYDKIVITIDDAHSVDKDTNEIRTSGTEMIKAVHTQLIELGVDARKVELSSVSYLPNDPRIVFLRHLAEMQESEGIAGAIAECGVFRGSFSSYMNRYFPTRRLYLFDTFEGFKQDDMEAENNPITIDWLKSQTIGILATGSAFIALLRCRNRENVIVKQGQVPKSLTGCENERFAFVNLDMDLYAPQLAGLRFFAPRMSKGGVILLHDYYWKWTPGVKQAVDAFAAEFEFRRLPIGDDSSIALLF
jgi:O-methyltransferase